jgi:hypothetical protein
MQKNFPYYFLITYVLAGRVADPHRFNADPDPGFDDLKLLKNFQEEIFIFIFLIKNCNLLIPSVPLRLFFAAQQRIAITYR